MSIHHADAEAAWEAAPMFITEGATPSDKRLFMMGWLHCRSAQHAEKLAALQAFEAPFSTGDLADAVSARNLI